MKINHNEILLYSMLKMDSYDNIEFIGRKLPADLDSPIDNLLIKLAVIVTPVFTFLKFTPNMITGLSLVTGLVSVYHLFMNNMFCYSLMYFVSYFFDVLDGFYARVTSQCSKFGDLFDHIKDNVIALALIAVMCYKYYVFNPVGYVYMSCMTFIVLTSAIHIGLQEKLYDDDFCFAMSPLKRLVSAIDTVHMSVTRFFTTGTLTLLIM